MYVAVAATIVGQALVQGQPILLPYAAAFAVAVATFVHLYEEPTLRRQFGEQYEEYRRGVPAWWPAEGPGRLTRVAIPDASQVGCRLGSKRRAARSSNRAFLREAGFTPALPRFWRQTLAKFPRAGEPWMKAQLFANLQV
jgi:hypothetical protein